MANWSTLKQAIANVIKTNGNNEITGQILQNALFAIVNSVGENYTFVGVADTSTEPGLPDGHVFYIATKSGEYSNFGGITIDKEVAIIRNTADGSWEKINTGILSVENLTEGGEIVVKVDVKPATETILGGINASPKTEEETVEAKIGKDNKLYVPASTSAKNLADEEDLTSKVEDSKSVMKFADKAYDASSFSGQGRVYLRKNIVLGKNILTQSMINDANTRYIIQYDYDLNGETISIPEGCTLDFQGGSISNGVLTGIINISDTTDYVFKDIQAIIGKTYLNEDYIRPEWFGAKGDYDLLNNIGSDDTVAFNLACKFSNISGCRKIRLSSKIYLINGTIDVHYGNVCFEGVFAQRREDTYGGSSSRNSYLYSTLYKGKNGNNSSLINILSDCSHPCEFRDINFVNDNENTINCNCINYLAQYAGPTWPFIIEKCYFRNFSKCFYNNASSVQYNISWLIFRDNAFAGNDWIVYFEDFKADQYNFSRHSAWAFEFRNNYCHQNSNFLRLGIQTDYCIIEENNFENNLSAYRDGTSTSGTYSIDIMAGLECSIDINKNHFEGLTHDMLKLYIENTISLSMIDNMILSGSHAYTDANIQGISNSLIRELIVASNNCWPIKTFGYVHYVSYIGLAKPNIKFSASASDVIVQSNVAPIVDTAYVKAYQGESPELMIGKDIVMSTKASEKLVISNWMPVSSTKKELFVISLKQLIHKKAPSVAQAETAIYCNEDSGVFTFGFGIPKRAVYVTALKMIPTKSSNTSLLIGIIKNVTSSFNAYSLVGAITTAVYDDFEYNTQVCKIPCIPQFGRQISDNTELKLALNGVNAHSNDYGLVYTMNNKIRLYNPVVLLQTGTVMYSSINDKIVDGDNGKIISASTNGVYGDIFYLGLINTKTVLKYVNQRFNIAMYSNSDYSYNSFIKIITPDLDTEFSVDTDAYCAAFSYSTSSSSTYKDAKLLRV